MWRFSTVISLGILFATAANADASGWQLHAADETQHLRLSYGLGEQVSYLFDCSAKEVIITETGVTKLLDLKTGAAIGDEAGAVMPAGAAMMALFSGKGEPEFAPAEATKNPAGGWDLTMRLPKDDKRLKAMGKGAMISLFTTGYTMSVPLSDDDRAMWKEFVQRCTAAG
ncbi:MAG: hypothetical protein V4618_18810 [Pseudomonadota bacterium]